MTEVQQEEDLRNPRIYLIPIAEVMEMLEAHWQEVVVTCPETCSCWDLFDFVLEQEAKGYNYILGEY